MGGGGATFGVAGGSGDGMSAPYWPLTSYPRFLSDAELASQYFEWALKV